MFRTANKTEAVATAQSQISIAFQRLDKEIRYAEGISTPTSSGTGWYVEYVTADHRDRDLHPAVARHRGPAAQATDLDPGRIVRTDPGVPLASGVSRRSRSRCPIRTPPSTSSGCG